VEKFHAPRLQDDFGDSRRNAWPGVLIVEDLPSTQVRLTSLIEKVCPNARPLLADSVKAARDLLRRLPSLPVDLALVDLFLPDGSGAEVIRELVRRDPLMICIVTTIYDDDAHLLPALAAGAQGYLLKDQSDEVLVTQLHLAMEGVPPLAPAIASRLVRHFAAMGLAARAPKPDGAQGGDDDDLVLLSGREQIVLSLIAKGLQIAQVARALNISAHTVCSHIKSIYRKRHLSCRAEAALEAQRLGLV
jgi:DNA-binding NarL/FixJ family response regulator